MDTVDAKTRSRIMASVGQKNTGPEMTLRSALHKSGLRYRLHVKRLPGTPDLVFPKYGAVVFVHGCYWHSHGCHKSTMPKSRRQFWQAKFRANRERDRRNHERLRESDWRVMTVWECALVGRHALTLPDVVGIVRRWLVGTQTEGEVPWTPPDHANTIG